MNVVQALDHPALFAPWFAGPSWDAWRAILKAAFALPMDPAEIEIFRALAEREPPQEPVRELWVIAGRRSGKDSIASLIAAYVAAFRDYKLLLRPGEFAHILCLANDRDQARIVQKYTRAYFSEIPMLGGLLVSDDNAAGSFELSTRAIVTVATNSFRAVRGRSLAAVVMDECAFWRDDRFANPDSEVYAAVTPGLSAPLANTILIGISSPYRRGGLLFSKWREHYGKAGDVLVIKAPTTALNPLIDQAIIDRALAADPEAAGAEWLAEWRSDLADFVDRAVVEAAVAPGRYELPRQAGVRYFGFCDPSGGSADSMTIAIAHADKEGRGVLDATREIRPPFSPEDVVVEFAALLKSYGLSSVTGDRYAGEWPRERFSEHGIRYEPAEKSKSELYIEFLPILNSGKADLLDNARLIAQLCSLERRTSRGTGRDSVDHPPGAHDDVANAAAGALVLAAGKADGLATWRAMGRDDPPPEPPHRAPAPPGSVWVNLPHPVSIVLGDGSRFDARPGIQTVPAHVASLGWMQRYHLPAEP
jgi:hypothetical protein